MDFFILYASWYVDDLKSNVSSTKREWVLEKDVHIILMPFHNPFWLKELISLLRASAIMINKNEERGSPWWTPWEEAKKLVGAPLMRIKKCAHEMRDLIHLHHLEEKPNWWRTRRRKDQFNLS